MFLAGPYAENNSEGFTEMISRRRGRRGVGLERGCPLPSRLGFCGASWAPLAGSGAEPRPQTPFQHFLSVTERFRWKENEILLLYMVTDKVQKFPDEHFGQCISGQCWQLQLQRFAEIVLKIFEVSFSGGWSRTPLKYGPGFWHARLRPFPFPNN